MSLLHYIRKTLRKKPALMAPQVGYDLWSERYDMEKGNLMVALDEIIFEELLQTIDLENKHIADVGCGTGRHWHRLYARQPASLTGFDVSAGMLDQLKQKYSDARVLLIEEERLPGVPANSIDLVVCTLAFAHFRDGAKVWAEWGRVLKSGGAVLLTDYHPDALQHGGDITFKYKNTAIGIEYYIYPLTAIRAMAVSVNLEEIALKERFIDESVRHYYESQNAMAVFQKFKGMPIIYGIHFRKP